MTANAPLYMRLLQGVIAKSGFGEIGEGVCFGVDATIPLPEASAQSQIVAIGL
jgi:hypothetical protein